ncbi:zonadhesin-like [Calliopsis andreniformis]|uniref:zonadhesin-like n=1 Tax=Calliopsis andreniformis TaxID=337506 RepID=UPI003FCD7C66
MPRLFLTLIVALATFAFISGSRSQNVLSHAESSGHTTLWLWGPHMSNAQSYTLGSDISKLVLAGQPKTCPKNEVYTPCNGHCQKNCSNPNPVCTKICVEGCLCKDDWLRNREGVCVPPQRCWKSSDEDSSSESQEKCPKNEVYDECSGRCQKTCEDPEPICPLICLGGCVCKNDWLRDQNGICIPPKKCNSNDKSSSEDSSRDKSDSSSESHERCPENEVYTECNGHCQRTCKRPNPICPLICIEGCICKKDWLRNSDGKCVPPRRCACKKRKSSDESKSSSESKSSNESK